MSKTTTVTIRLPITLLDEMKAKAADLGKTVPEYARGVFQEDVKVSGKTRPVRIRGITE